MNFLARFLNNKDWYIGVFTGMALSMFTSGLAFGAVGQTNIGILFFFVATGSSLAAMVFDYVG